ncbi:MAG: hypothetical protein RIC55_14855 [Pirellulaceae bacterium]
MLVIISDLHLTDGTCSEDLSSGALRIFAGRLCDLAHRASWRTDGRYEPIDRIDLVLLGDVIDLVRSTRWLEGGVRPWHDTSSPQVVDTVGRIVDGILRNNGESLSVLRSLASDGAVAIPPAASTGQAAYESPPQPVAVRTHYMVGNHDWLLHLPGANYDLVRQKVAHHAGLANPHRAPFPHDPLESEELLEALRRHRVLARHGDIFDPLNFTEDRDTSSLGDCIVIELVGRFQIEVQQQLGDELPEAVAAALKEIDHIRPLLLIPMWLDGVLERACPLPAVRKKVKAIWDRLVDELLALEAVRDHDTWSPVQLVDGLERALKFSKRLSIGWAAKVASWLYQLRGAEGESYYQHALAEQDFRNRRARHIVYGHTHQPESLALDASYADGYVLNQMYFNTGTWRRVYHPTRLAVGGHEFIPTDAMTYLAFFQADERGGRPFESWTGTLGAAPAELAEAQQQVAAAASSTRHRAFDAPHFAVPNRQNAGRATAPVRR